YFLSDEVSGGKRPRWPMLGIDIGITQKMLKFQHGAGEYLLQLLGLMIKNGEQAVNGQTVQAFISAIGRNHHVGLQALLYAIGSCQCCREEYQRMCVRVQHEGRGVLDRGWYLCCIVF